MVSSSSRLPVQDRSDPGSNVLGSKLELPTEVCAGREVEVLASIRQSTNLSVRSFVPLHP